MAEETKAGEIARGEVRRGEERRGKRVHHFDQFLFVRALYGKCILGYNGLPFPRVVENASRTLHSL